MNNIGHDAQEMLDVLSEKQKVLHKKMNIKLQGNQEFTEACGLVTRDDMNEISQFWNAGKCAKLKKNEFADAIKESMLNGLDEKIKKVDKSILLTLEQLVKNNGIVTGEECRKMNDESVFYLKNHGIIFVGKNEENQNVVMIPKDILNKVKDLVSNKEVIERIDQNELVLRITKGILYYIGILELEALTNFIGKLSGTSLNAEAVQVIICENEKKNNDIKFIEKIEEIEDYTFVSNGKLSKPLEIIYAQNSVNLGYKEFQIKEILDAGIQNFAHWRNPHKELFDHIIKNYDVGEAEAKMLVNAVIFGLKDGSTILDTLEVLNACFMFDSNEERRGFEKILLRVQNETRLWALKGYMPCELKPRTVVKNEKIGRNDICPCGSGKKYKKCCGK